MDKETLMNSELVYHILKSIAEEPKTPTELSKEVETSAQSINNYLKTLKDLGAVTKEQKQGRKQPYSVEDEDLRNFILDLFRNYVDDIMPKDKSSKEALSAEIEMHDVFAPYDVEQAFGDDLDTLLIEFLVAYTKFVDKSTLNEVFERFLDGIEMIDLDNYDIEWLSTLRTVSKHRHGYVRDPEALMHTAIMEYQSYPNTIEKRNKFFLHTGGEGIPDDVDTETIRKCPECDYRLGEDTKFSNEGTYTCSNCKSEFEKPKYETKYKCPKCGNVIENPEHKKDTECGCGKILNKAQLEIESKGLED